MKTDELTLLKTYLNVQNQTRAAIKSLQFLVKGEIPNNLQALNNRIKSINLTLQSLNEELRSIVLTMLIS